MKKRFGNIFLAFAMSLFLISGMAYGANANKGSKTAKLAGTSDFRVTAEKVNKTLVNVGQVAMWVRANGETAREPGGDSMVSSMAVKLMMVSLLPSVSVVQPIPRAWFPERSCKKASAKNLLKRIASGAYAGIMPPLTCVRMRLSFFRSVLLK